VAFARLPGIGPFARVALACTLLAGAVPAYADETPASGGQTLAPLEIVQRAVGVWNARPTPPFMAYDLDFHGAHKTQQFYRRVHVVYDAGNRTCTTQLLQASGGEPPGVNAERQRLFPDETFGLVPRVRSGTSESASGASIQTLAVAHAVTRYPYDVSLAGIETVAGHAAYHLRFAPRSDPEHYSVREVWVDSTSFDVRRVIAYKVQHVGLVSIPFLLSVEYGESGPYWLVVRGEAGATAHLIVFTVSAQGIATYSNFTFPQSVASGS
jgi:hypothetical protein